MSEQPVKRYWDGDRGKYIVYADDFSRTDAARVEAERKVAELQAALQKCAGNCEECGGRGHVTDCQRTPDGGLSFPKLPCESCAHIREALSYSEAADKAWEYDRKDSEY